MTKIQVGLIDMAGNVNTLPLPDDKPLQALVSSIVTLLDLTETDSLGRTLDYRLFSRRLQRVLSFEGSLYSNGITEDDQLWIVPAPFHNALELEMLSDPSQGARLPIPQRQRITIGRSSDNDLVIRHEAISRQHGELNWQDGLHIYRDLNSANGSTINNQIVSEPMPISIGSILCLGDIRLRYQASATDEITRLVGQEPVVLGTYQTSGNTDILRTSLSPLPRGSVFINYAPGQREIATIVAEQLRRSNFQIFWDQEIPPGSNAAEVWANGLRLADAMVMILSMEAVATSHLLQACNDFLLMRKPIVPVVYEDCPIPKSLQSQTPVKFVGSFNRLTNEVVVALFRALR
jgi:hypothetical protein